MHECRKSIEQTHVNSFISMFILKNKKVLNRGEVR